MASKSTDVRPKITSPARSARSATTSPRRTGATTPTAWRCRSSARAAATTRRTARPADRVLARTDARPALPGGRRRVRGAAPSLLAFAGMAVDASLAGRTFPPTAALRRHRAGRGRVRRRDRPPDAAGDPAPPTFPIVVAFDAMQRLIVDPTVGIELHRIVHGEQRFSYERPVAVGDRLTATLTVDVAAPDRRRRHHRHLQRDHRRDRRPGLHGRGDPGAPQGGRLMRGAGRRDDLRRHPRRPGRATPGPAATTTRSTGRPGGPLGRPARRDRARHVHPGAGRPRRRRAGPASRAGSPSSAAKFTKPVVVPDDDTGAEVRIAARSSGRRRARHCRLEVTCGGEKVLGMPEGGRCVR